MEEIDQLSAPVNSFPVFSEWFDLPTQKQPLELEPQTPRMSLSQQQSRLLHDIQISLTVQLGSVTLSAANVIDLVPGQILAYPIDISRTVTLTLGSDTIALAKLVTVDADLGLEILEVSFPANKQSETKTEDPR